MSTVKLMLLLFLSHAAAAQDLSDGLVAHFPLNQDADDVSAFQNDGTEYGIGSFVQHAQTEALALSGGGYVGVPPDASYFMSSEGSVFVRFKASDLTTLEQGLVSKKHGSGYSLRLNTHGFMGVQGQFRGVTGDIAVYIPLSMLAVDAWHAVLLTCDADQVAIYLDGYLVETAPMSKGPLGDNSNDCLIIGSELDSGCNATSKFHFSGEIDEVRIYNRALTPTEALWLNSLFDTSTNCLAPIAKSGQRYSFEFNDDGDLEPGVCVPDSRFVDHQDGTVTDRLTAVTWLRANDCIGPLTWADALDALNDLAAPDCSLSDESESGSWRMPSVRELISLVDFGRSDPALPTGHPFAFGTGPVWSSTTLASNPLQAWSVDLLTGALITYDKSLPAGIWAVKSVSKEFPCLDTAIVLTVLAPPGVLLDIRYREQDLKSGDQFEANPGDTLQWRIDVNGYTGPWRQYEVHCSHPFIATTNDDVTNVLVQDPTQTGQIDLRYGPHGIVDGEAILLPVGMQLQWRFSANGFRGPWLNQTIESSSSIVVDQSVYCAMPIDIPLSEGTVDLRYGPHGLENGDSVTLPQNINVQWRLNSHGFDGPWLSHYVGVTCALEIDSTHYCELLVDIPFENGTVDLRYGQQGLVNGSVVAIPKDIDIQWRLTSDGFRGPWLSHRVESPCSLIITPEHYCVTQIMAPPDIQVDIRYGPHGLLDGDQFHLPKNIIIQWRSSMIATTSWQDWLVEEPCSIDANSPD